MIGITINGKSWNEEYVASKTVEQFIKKQINCPSNIVFFGKRDAEKKEALLREVHRRCVEMAKSADRPTPEEKTIKPKK